MAWNGYPDLSQIHSEATDKDTITEPEHASILAGDYKDDDGVILDEFFEANPNLSPAPTERPEYPNLTVKDTQPAVTRIMGRTFKLDLPIVDPDDGDPFINFDAVMALPADPNRKSVTITTFSYTYPDLIVFVGSEKTDVETDMNAGGFAASGGDSTAQSNFTLDGHTGAVWIRVLLVGNPLTVGVLNILVTATTI